MKLKIVKAVLENEHGNHNLTADRLGISRTTLWRMLNEG
ncbi:helix-turn-helix domain-containing protein [Eremococcus coleocola]